MTAVPPGARRRRVADGYERQNGTSFAAPMVAAAVAWVRAARPDLTADQVDQAVRLSARDVGPDGWEPDTGFGVLSVGRALTIPPVAARPARSRTTTSSGSTGARSAGPTACCTPAAAARASSGYSTRSRIRPTSTGSACAPHTRKRISADPAGSDNVALRVYSRAAKSLGARPLKSSARRGSRTETVTLRNRSGRARVYYVAVRVQGRSDLDAAYTLRVG